MTDTTPRPFCTPPNARRLIQAAAHPATAELALIGALCRELRDRIGTFRREHPAGNCQCPTCLMTEPPDSSGSDLHDALAVIQGALCHGEAILFHERPLTTAEWGDDLPGADGTRAHRSGA